MINKGYLLENKKRGSYSKTIWISSTIATREWES